jgi:hypothetical protein
MDQKDVGVHLIDQLKLKPWTTDKDILIKN